MTLCVKKLKNNARLPTQSTPGAAGFDLYADEDCCIYPHPLSGSHRLVSTGIALSIDPDKVGLIWPRSGLATRHGIQVGAGVIDSDYRGEIKVLLFNLGNSIFEIKRGDRIAQILIMPVYGQTILEVDDLGNTARGAFGFGSTGD